MNEVAEQCIDRATLCINDHEYAKAYKYLKKAKCIEANNPMIDKLINICLNNLKSQESYDNKEETNVQENTNNENTEQPSYTPEQLKYVEVINQTEDYYEILNIERTATISEIKKGYKKVVIKVHPDKNHAPGAEDAFKKVSEAYTILSDEQKRSIYDSQGIYGIHPEYANTQSRAQYESEVDPDELFREFFGNLFPGGESIIYINGRPYRSPFMRARHPQYTYNYADYDNIRNRRGIICRLIIFFVLFIAFSLFSMNSSYHEKYSLYKNEAFPIQYTTKLGNFYYLGVGQRDKFSYSASVDKKAYEAYFQTCNNEYYIKGKSGKKASLDNIESCRTFFKFRDEYRRAYPYADL